MPKTNTKKNDKPKKKPKRLVWVGANVGGFTTPGKLYAITNRRKCSDGDVYYGFVNDKGERDSAFGQCFMSLKRYEKYRARLWSLLPKVSK
jgi:hypothetical protein